MCKWMAGAAVAAMLAGAVAPAGAQQAALEGPLTIVVGFAPSGTADRVARLVASRLAERVGVPVVVENKSGAGGRIAAQGMRAASAEQNVLMLANPAVMVVGPLVYAKPGYDPQRDFKPVSLVTRYKFALAVPPDSQIKNLADLRQWIEAHPRQLTIGVPATGSLPHFFALMLGRELKEQPEVVGYRGSTPVINELVGGVLPQGITTLDTLLPLAGSGKVRILAVSGEKRDADLPDVPTFREEGVNLVAEGWNAFFAPAAMPQARIERLGADIAAVMKEPEMQEAVRAAFLEPVSMDAGATAEALAAYQKQWEPVVRASGFKADQ
ncbi:ABC transporter substrate-binding protein [Achromobacter pulmonis]|uniref:ABC transporter substrate-binding protein n=1 Tax=Achromobacter pulmonis TaxID=1389932 RepID=A0A2N8KLV1_9BURK|nr:ABC transporter substrate-binding protein [Achromobacter pulmonis]